MSSDASDWLQRYLSDAPAALALLRAIECRGLSQHAMVDPVLDLGCGDGLTARLLSEQRQVVFSAGLDRSNRALRAAQNVGAHRLLVCGDIAHIPIQEHSVCTVLSNCVLEHVHDLSAALCEIRRVLRPGGRLIFTVPTAQCAPQLVGAALFRKAGLTALARAYARLYDRKLGHLHLYDADAWKSILQTNGFERIACQAYASPVTLRLHDLMAPLGLGSLLLRRLTGRWILSKRMRLRLGAPLMALLLRRVYEQDGPGGCSLLMVATSR